MGDTTTAALFDVDGTLTTTTSMFRFLEYWMAAQGQPPYAYQSVRQRLDAMTAAGVPRSATNRTYFSTYADADADAVAVLAREWFAVELKSGGFFNESTLSQLRRHRDAGDLIVLVSGSFPACLTPIARYLGADAVLCSEPEIISGRYTGRVHQPMIAGVKAAALRQLAGERHIDLRASTAYGDHSSDLPMLRLAGCSVVVGNDPDLHQWAQYHDWHLLPGAPEPPPLSLPEPGHLPI